MKELTYTELLDMENKQVRVEDDVNDYHNQICKVVFENEVCAECGNEYKRITLENEDYNFDYDKNGNCLDGDFKVYSID